LNKNYFIRKLLENKIPDVFKNAKAIICGSHYLFNFATKYNNNVHLLPTVIQNKKYNCTEEKIDNSKFIIGWIGSKSTSKYVVEILPALINFLNSKDNVYLHLIGFYKKLQYKMNHPKIQFIEWDESTEIKELCKFSVGIMPLPDTPWTRGKCGFKLIQYMALGLPVICSPVGENKKIVVNRVNGLFAISNDNWVQAFETLYVDSKLRKSMGEKNKAYVSMNYSLASTSKKYLEIIKTSIG